MKKFYRRANESDFEEVGKYWRDQLPEEVRELLNNCEFHKGIQVYRRRTGIPLIDSKRIADNYMNYRKAYKDFAVYLKISWN